MNLTFRLIIILVTATFSLNGFSQPKYADYFSRNTLRFNFLLAGNSEKIHVFPQSTEEEKEWSGSEVNLVDTGNFGTYRYQVFDAESEKLIFSRGFATLFQEWQTTAEAKLMDRAFYQAIFFPFPVKKVKLSIDARNRRGNFEAVFVTTIDPADYFIHRQIPEKMQTLKIIESGKHKHAVDIVFVAEGYTMEQKLKFMDDATRMTNYLFEQSPFAENKSKFNVTAVFVPSAESGTDIPGEHIYRNTKLNSTFYTFDTPRYLTTSDMKSVYDVAAGVTWDQIVVLVNTELYGGGGFYNFLSVCSADHELSEKVFVHEYGHSFAGLGDEYYNSSVAYDDFYNLEIEPWEPNLTTMVNFSSKWKNKIKSQTPVPTPRIDKYRKTVGVFEGGGYRSAGIFSPMMDCRMKSNTAEGFCPVCISAIQRAIDWHSK